MRTWKVAAALSVVFVAVTAVPEANHAAWPTTAATRCWSIDSGIFLKARITPVGGGFYSVHQMYVENGTVQYLGTGTAYLRDGMVYWVDGGAGAGVGSAAMAAGQCWTVLNRTTLIGRSECIGHDMNYSDETLDTEYSKRDPLALITPVSCSAIWQ